MQLLELDSAVLQFPASEVAHQLVSGLMVVRTNEHQPAGMTDQHLLEVHAMIIQRNR